MREVVKDASSVRPTLWARLHGTEQAKKEKAPREAGLSGYTLRSASMRPAPRAVNPGLLRPLLLELLRHLVIREPVFGDDLRPRLLL